jgi:hypothetical protein
MRVAVIRDGQIVNVILRADGSELLPGEMLEADAIAAGIPRYVEPQPDRKIWPTVADFWAEFSETEQIAIIDSDIPGIRLLDRQLLVWRGEVWSDDERVQQGLGGLVAVGILTAERREEILQP